MEKGIEKAFGDLVKECGDHLLAGLIVGDFNRIASFSLSLNEYLRKGASQFTTMVTVYIMRYITERSQLAGRGNMKIVAQVNQRDQEVVFVNFRWLTPKMKAELKKVNPQVVELCWICKQNKPAAEFKRCGACREACYCSIACQRLSWPEHRKECVKIAK